MSDERLAFGGGCHWCTEAIFHALRGVSRVEQGWVGSEGDDAWLSEAVIVHFDPQTIDVDTLVAVHLHTHSSTSMHALRTRYRSAVYTWSAEQTRAAEAAIARHQRELPEPIITRVLAFREFVANEERYLDYYRKAPELPFCQTNIAPKLRIVRERFAAYAVDPLTSRRET